MNVCQCCAVVLHQRTTFQSSQAFNLLSFVALELHFVLARRAMEPGHLLHSALTRPSSANARRLKSRHPFAPVAQQLISSSDDSRSAAIWAYHRWKAEWADNTTILRTFIPDLGTLLEWPCQKQRGSGLTASAPVSDVSALAYTYGVWRPLLRPVNVAQVQRNKLTTMSFTVQTIVLPMDCMAWRFWWDNRMPSTPAPISIVRPSSWWQGLAQNDEEAAVGQNRNWNIMCILMSIVKDDSLQLKKISRRFMWSGHPYLPSDDCDFSHIEKRMKL